MAEGGCGWGAPCLHQYHCRGTVKSSSPPQALCSPHKTGFLVCFGLGLAVAQSAGSVSPSLPSVAATQHAPFLLQSAQLGCCCLHLKASKNFPGLRALLPETSTQLSTCFLPAQAQSRSTVPRLTEHITHQIKRIQCMRPWA